MVTRTQPRIAVFVCHPADSPEGPVDLHATAAYAAGLAGFALLTVGLAVGVMLGVLEGV